ncbi:MAG TPA: LysR family transcriptional regulator [Povalibacter sp.]|nr:LysR family transcriptional regulator [Povalibacter sp.]
MKIPRRFLPSLAALSAFEAAARTGSVTAAALELNLTQSAVSRQIKLLEQQLEVPLFWRERQTIRLTAAGHAYAREIRESLEHIGAASMNLRANPAGGTLNLAVLPAFGTNWLVPRLPKFIGANPNVMVNLVTQTSPFDFRTKSLDAALHYGTDNWMGAESVFLCADVVAPLCSPELQKRFAFEQPEDLRKAPLLHLKSRPDAWEQWLGHHGVPADHVRGMLFDQWTTAGAAAAAGLGVALLPTFLFEEELKRSTLVCAIDRPMRTTGGYYLFWSTDRADYPPLVAFRRWLVDECSSIL